MQPNYVAHQPTAYQAQQQLPPSQPNSHGILGATPALYPSQPTTLPSAFSTMSLQDPTWNMDTGATSYLNSNLRNLSIIFNKHLFSSIHVGDGNSIPVTNTGHSIIPSGHRPLHLHNVLVTPNIIKNLISVRQFTRDDNCTIEFDTFGFSVKDFLTCHILLRCDNSGDLYQVTKSSNLPATFVSTSSSTWHQRLGHPGDKVLRSLSSRHFISCNKEKSSHICHACHLGKHVKLPFHSSDSIVTKCFDIIHSDLWTSPIGSQVAYLLIYVDDIILTASYPVLLRQIVDSLHKEFDMTDLGKYALQLLERAHMVNGNPSRTPVDTDSKLGTLELGLHLYASATTSLVGYTDADWAGCSFTRSAEAEYRGVANVVAKTAWIRNLLRELRSSLLTATLVYCDNVSAVYMSANLVQHQRTKHIEIDIHFVRDMVNAGHVWVLHVPSRFQYADIFTKGLPLTLFEDVRSSLSVRPPPAQTAGEY
ncbi:ribonuclease H-like domain-containing protein [Tanacetum coccineum]|uniref:Ribonuclease H-like domain-containing protein n=1 Tax=Tanacetum coccineum TaxID=301880 RepID=A0ABQ5BF45_9ASTR